ncbi:hypothetical protein BJY04DRAFT_189932 [Aspergillus karnatakaensis]|uniref:uncharacterized protein n=1 Tax=Aspergillus karnatakaensis TaxID=1810916 RepID=UPI003CCCB935
MGITCPRVASDFLQSPAHGLLRPTKDSSETTRREKELQSLYYDAGSGSSVSLCTV